MSHTEYSVLFNFKLIGQVIISHATPQTTLSNRKTSTISDTKTAKTDRHHSLAAGARGALASSGDGTSQVTINYLLIILKSIEGNRTMCCASCFLPHSNGSTLSAPAAPLQAVDAQAHNLELPTKDDTNFIS